MFKKTRHQLTRLRLWARRSQYARPIIIFTLFLGLCAILTVIFEIGSNGQFKTLLDGFWWVIITFSTTGYGDKVPITLGGRIVAVITILVGIAAMSLLSGGLASWLVERNTRARRGLVDYTHMKQHIIICGWKDDMKEILVRILDASPNIVSDQLILTSNVDSDKVEALRDSDMLRGLKYVRGDYFSESTLRRAGIAKARKVIIMADVWESDDQSEVDSKTVLAVLTIKSIARDVYVMAELLDRKYESYLRQAACDEILFSKDVSRLVLANASASSGISHIFYELLTHHNTRARLITIEIPKMFIDRSYSDLKAHIEEDNERQMIGLLENTGSPASMKIESLRNAQKTSDVSQLISNLQRVKGLTVNQPVLIPDADHIIQSHMLGIVVERVYDNANNGEQN